MNAKPGKFLALLYYSFIISSIILKTESSFKKDSVFVLHFLFHRHTLRQISRLVHIQSLGYADIVSQQLQRDHCQ